MNNTILLKCPLCPRSNVVVSTEIDLRKHIIEDHQRHDVESLVTLAKMNAAQ